MIYCSQLSYDYETAVFQVENVPDEFKKLTLAWQTIVSRPKTFIKFKENYDFHYTPDKTFELSIITNLHSSVTVNKATWSKL